MINPNISHIVYFAGKIAEDSLEYVFHYYPSRKEWRYGLASNSENYYNGLIIKDGKISAKAVAEIMRKYLPHYKDAMPFGSQILWF